jgi:hypothetical protein
VEALIRGVGSRLSLAILQDAYRRWKIRITDVLEPSRQRVLDSPTSMRVQPNSKCDLPLIVARRELMLQNEK